MPSCRLKNNLLQTDSFRIIIILTDNETKGTLHQKIFESPSRSLENHSWWLLEESFLRRVQAVLKNKVVISNIDFWGCWNKLVFASSTVLSLLFANVNKSQHLLYWQNTKKMRDSWRPLYGITQLTLNLSPKQWLWIVALHFATWLYVLSLRICRLKQNTCLNVTFAH